MWRTKPIIIQIEGAPLTLRFSSLRAYQYSLGLAALSLVLAGWLFGSGLLALKAMFEPSVEILRSTERTSPAFRQERARRDETSPNYGVRWTTTNSAYAGTNPTGIPAGKDERGHE